MNSNASYSRSSRHGLALTLLCAYRCGAAASLLVSHPQAGLLLTTRHHLSPPSPRLQKSGPNFLPGYRPIKKSSFLWRSWNRLV